MQDHQVGFYEDDAFFINSVTDYIGHAIASGNTGIAIATEAHLRKLDTVLQQRGLIDANGHAPGARYVRLQTEDMLPQLLVHGLPDAARFRQMVGGLFCDVIARAEPPGKLCVFGEISAIVCTTSKESLHPGGRHASALLFEQYFHDLQRSVPFSLRCAYPLDAFPHADDADMFAQVCKLHTEVFPAETFDPHASANSLRRNIAALQQQAHALTTEIFARRRIELALREVNVDQLTGLPNRNVFQDRLDMDIKKAQRSGRPLALLFIDLDHFKEINDTHGHQVGDQLLKQVGQRLHTYVRESDTVARLGGDEFTVTLSELRDPEAATDVAQKIGNDLSKPFHLGEEMAYISASIGITLYPRDGLSAGELLRNADQAMYRSKDLGRNRFTYFTSSMQEAAQQRMALSNDLRRAIEFEQLEVFYQPIVDMRSGRISKAEALARWHHPERGTISPSEFIPIAEHTGQIVTLGNWVFEQAVAQARRSRHWNEHMTINVNVSPAQFYQSDGDSWCHWLDANELKAGKPGTPVVGIEITEGLLLASSGTVLKQLLAFHQAGIQISLDDFGTGYSALSYLRKFDLDYLKIDKSFVYNLEHDAANLALCEAIIVMAHKLGLKVIAEGVETDQQSDILRAAGCDYGQGFLFGEPVCADTFDHLLSRNPLIPFDSMPAGK